MISEGIDPCVDKKMCSVTSDIPTFTEIALDWHKTKVKSWAEKYADGILTIFNNDIFLLISSMLVNQIKPLHVFSKSKQIKERGAL